MQPTLVILAAGMASRYGSMKQTQQFGPSGETIMDYSIFDAIQVGFKKVVFIIRKDFEESFKQVFEPKLQGKIQTAYVFQEMQAFIDDYNILPERNKPWGTAHAVLCAQNEVNEPFAVINADDFYGHDAFAKAYQFLTAACNEKNYALIGYELRKTLSDNGSVSRGVCRTNAQQHLISIAERTKIYSKNNQIVYEEDGKIIEEDKYAKASMNFWCFYPNIFPLIQQLFKQFLKANGDNPKSEFFIPIVADYYIQQKLGVINVIPTEAQWFGVTYKEDAPHVAASIQQMIQMEQYPSSLWENAKLFKKAY